MVDGADVWGVAAGDAVELRAVGAVPLLHTSARRKRYGRGRKVSKEYYQPVRCGQSQDAKAINNVNYCITIVE